MADSLYIAWRYVRYHKIKTAILVASITLILFLPAGLDVLVRQSAAQLRDRATLTPLLVGAKGSELDLVLNTLYFESTPPSVIEMSETYRVRESEFALAIPMYVRFRAKGYPIVGTGLEYFEFRGLRLCDGRLFTLLGECVLGSGVADALQLSKGDGLMSSSENVFDIAGVYPLKMHVVGVLQPTGTPDDLAVFADVRTTWVIQGLGHGHQDLSKPDASSVVLKKDGNRVTANAAVLKYNEITPENARSFHFHGNTQDFPITAVLAVPHDEKARALLMGRYQADDDDAQIVRPSIVMDELLATVLRVRTFVMAGAALLGMATLLTIVLVFMLSLRLRKPELITMAKLGCSRLRICGIVGCEILLVIAVSVLCAGGLTIVTRQFATTAIRWFLLQS
jgi:putative ABC transport system permease protein